MSDGPHPSTRRALSVTAALDKGNLSSADPALLLVEITIVDKTTGLPTGDVIRVVNTSKEISTTDDDGGGIGFRGNYYSPAAFDIQLKEASGEIPEVTLSIHDVTGIVRSYMDAYGGAVGSMAKLMVVWRSALPSGKAEIQESFQIIGGNISDRDVSLTLGAPSLLAITFPRRRQTRDFCQWQYKGIECGYTGVLTDCDRTLKGANGCEEHDNVRNFGGFPGIQQRGFLR